MTSIKFTPIRAKKSLPPTPPPPPPPPQQLACQTPCLRALNAYCRRAISTKVFFSASKTDAQKPQITAVGGDGLRAEFSSGARGGHTQYPRTSGSSKGTGAARRAHAERRLPVRAARQDIPYIYSGFTTSGTPDAIIPVDFIPYRTRETVIPVDFIASRTRETMIHGDFVPSRVGATVHGRPQRRNCGMMFDNIYGGHKACNYDYGDDYGGHPAPAGRALPNLLMRSKC
jgi:hypothetical protein